MSIKKKEWSLQMGYEQISEKKIRWIFCFFLDEKMFDIDGVYNSQNERICAVNRAAANTSKVVLGWPDNSLQDNSLRTIRCGQFVARTIRCRTIRCRTIRRKDNSSHGQFVAGQFVAWIIRCKTTRLQDNSSYVH